MKNVSAQAYKGMDSLQLRDRLSSYVMQRMFRSGRPRDEATRAVEELMLMVDPLIYGKMPIATGAYIDMPQSRRQSLAEQAKEYLRSQAKGDWALVDEASNLIDVISSYGQSEARERGGVANLMMMLGNLAKQMDTITIDLKPISPEVRTPTGRPVGPGYYEMIVSGESGGKPKSRSLLDVKLGDADPDETEGKLNDAVARLLEAKNSPRDWLRALTVDPLETTKYPAGQRPTEMRHRSGFQLGAVLVEDTLEKLRQLYEQIRGVAKPFMMPPVISIFDGLFSELRQSMDALRRAAMGQQTLDLNQFEPETKEAAVRVSDEDRELRQLLIDASMTLQRLKQKVSSTISYVFLEESGQDGNEERLLRWEISLVTGIANRGIEAIRQLLNDREYWNQSQLEALPSTVP